jgi:hypothetical protein
MANGRYFSALLHATVHDMERMFVDGRLIGILVTAGNAR